MKQLIIFFVLCLSSFSAMACYDGFCSGDRVISSTGDNRLGVVTQIYYNGTVRVQFDRSRARVVETYNLAKAVSCSHGICAGQRIIHSFGPRDTGTVVEVFSNGLTKVDWDRSRRDGIVSAYYLQNLGYGHGVPSCGSRCDRPRDYDVYDNHGTCRYGYCD